LFGFGDSRKRERDWTKDGKEGKDRKEREMLLIAKN